jgi:hypothetical protein
MMMMEIISPSMPEETGRQQRKKAALIPILIWEYATHA